MTIVEVIFWVCAALLVYTQLGYGLLLAVLVRIREGMAAVRRRAQPAAAPTSIAGQLPRVSVIVAAYAEQEVIADKVRNLLALGYPRQLLEVIVACDGSPDHTAERARDAGADLVLELPRGGKVLAQDAAVRRAAGEILAFSDANSHWHPSALHMLVNRMIFDDRVGYVCGHVSFTAEQGAENQEGLYWRYEMFMRANESRLASITAGNGAIYAVRREAYMELGAIMSHDIAFPFTMVRNGWRALYASGARASEKMAPTIDGEFGRKRRMAGRSWAVIARGRMFSARGYGPMYALMIFSHRFLRYLAPPLHVVALIASLVLLGEGWLYAVCAALQLALLAAAWAAPALSRLALPAWLAVGARLALICRYYVVTTASLGLGMWDWMRGRQRVTWEPAEGTR